MELPSPRQAARSNALRYVDCADAGIRRIRRGRGFAYLACDGSPVSDAKTLDRIAALVLPPAWRDVWICPNANGHLQATGLDIRGRKQYRYHAEWTAHRNLSKFDGLAAFARVLPKLRRRVRQDLALPGIPKAKVLACIVHLLDIAHIRIGNPEYARDNHSYGLTTIRARHATVHGGDIHFRFRAKSGKVCDLRLHDPVSAAVVRRCQCLPGQVLFAYLDRRGKAHAVTSSDVNEYLHRAGGLRITAKDFRTWGGTTVAAQTLLARSASDKDSIRAEHANLASALPALPPSPPLSAAEIKRSEIAAVRAAAAALGNTVATCRKFYVHPRLIAAYSDGALHEALQAAHATRSPRELHVVERAIAALLAGEMRPARRAGRQARAA